MSSTHDAVVIGAGPNGLVAANYLADAGWSVIVLEAQPHIGGAVRSDDDVHPGFTHDTFSSFYPLAAASPTITSFGLEEHGLTWRHAPAVLGHPLPDGDWALLHRDREITGSLLEQLHRGDGEAWLKLCSEWDDIGEQIVHALLTPFPPVRSSLAALARLPRVGGLEFVKAMLTPVVDFGVQRFHGPGPRLLLAGNAGHSDIPITSPGSGLMGLLMSMLAQTVGFPVPEGGASGLSEALARRFRSRGGEIHCGAEVTAIDVEGRRATVVRTAGGDRYPAGRAVIASVVATHLYGGLLAPDDVPARTARAMKRFQRDPSTVKVDWALSSPLPWASPPVHQPGTFHVATSVQEMAEATAQVASGAVPRSPFMLAGQMTATDPTRSPKGTEALWAYTHVPQDVVADAGEGGISGSWDADDLERLADRMQARIEHLAPGFESTVLARRILGPRELEARDSNLIGGAINGGTSQLHQQLIFRPVPGLGRAETPIKGLYLASASAHPGGGVHGAPGVNAARAAIAHSRLHRLIPHTRAR